MTSHPKRPRDPNQLAKSIIDIATGQKPDRDPMPEEQGKDPAAVALGKKGGLKGGAAGRRASMDQGKVAGLASSQSLSGLLFRSDQVLAIRNWL